MSALQVVQLTGARVATDEELAAVRAAAASDGVSLRAFAHRAVLDAANEHKRRVVEAARIVAERSAELNRRLA